MPATRLACRQGSEAGEIVLDPDMPLNELEVVEGQCGRGLGETGTSCDDQGGNDQRQSWHAVFSSVGGGTGRCVRRAQPLPVR